MPLPDSSPRRGEGKVFSSSSPYGRKEGAAARGMLHVKRASRSPRSKHRDYNIAIPHQSSQDGAPPGAAPAPQGVPVPGGGSRGRSEPGSRQVSLQPRASPFATAGPGPGLPARTRATTEPPPAVGTLFPRLCPPWLGVFRSFAALPGRDGAKPRVERDAGGTWGGRCDQGGHDPSGAQLLGLVKPCFEAAFSLA